MTFLGINLEKDAARATIPVMANIPAISPSVPPSCLPQQFIISIGGFFNGGFSVAYENGALIVQKGTPGDRSTGAISPSPEAWQTFWSKLDVIGVWKWRKGKDSYWNHGVMDGTQWGIDIKFGKKRIKCDGSNSYPLEDGSPNDEPTKSFSEFEKAVSELIEGIKLSQDPDGEEEEDEEAFLVKWQYYLCPRCGSAKAVEIIYGMPIGAAFKLSEEGKLVIGGCCQEIGAPDRSCPDCKHEWDSTKKVKRKSGK